MALGISPGLSPTWLVIALVLVPSVLLLIVAALAANADSLISVGY